MKEPAPEVPSSIMLRVGETQVLRLAGRGSAGYRWFHSVRGDDAAVSITERPAPRPVRDEAGGPPPDTYSLDTLFLIEARSPGHATIDFAQLRSWEKEEPPLSRHILEVTVTR